MLWLQERPHRHVSRTISDAHISTSDYLWVLPLLFLPLFLFFLPLLLLLLFLPLLLLFFPLLFLLPSAPPCPPPSLSSSPAPPPPQLTPTNTDTRRHGNLHMCAHHLNLNSSFEFAHISGCNSFCRCSKCFYVYLNTHPMGYFFSGHACKILLKNLENNNEIGASEGEFYIIMYIGGLHC